MYDEVVERILKSLGESSIADETYPKSSGGYVSHKIDAKNFHKISKNNQDTRIAFIDAGNAEIIGSANFSLNLVRVCYAIYESSKRISAKKTDIFAFVKAENKNKEIHYSTSIFSIDGFSLENLSFSSFDDTLMHGRNRAEIGSVANALRRFAELKLAKFVSENRLAGIIILDGNLQCTLTTENKKLEELYESCMKNNVILAALSKTNSVFTENGNLLSVVLNNIANLPSWAYYPIFEINNENHKAEMYFLKLHESSRHVFRFDIFNMQIEKAMEAIGALAENCRDPVFIGYPYGLVEADKMARVSNQEKESIKTMFRVKLGKGIEKYINSSNAHEILDKITF